MKPQLLEAGLSVDDRGQIIFANDFSMDGIKRFYIVENFSTDTVRGFHAHEKEAKYAMVIAGSAIFYTVEMPAIKEQNPMRFVLSSRTPKILFVPGGFAHGFRSLEPGTKILFLSTATLEESNGDYVRFSYDLFGSDIWCVVNR